MDGEAEQMGLKEGSVALTSLKIINLIFNTLLSN